MSYCILLLSTIFVDINSPLYKKNHLSSNKERIIQYLNGIKKVKELNPESDIYISDNSNYLNEKSDILQYLIENNIHIIKDAPNNYGKINKGAGLIENWKHNISLLKKYEYIIHFEPRLLLIDNYFINNFLENKRNLFTLNHPILMPHFNTGLFTIKSDILINYINTIKINVFCNNSISIENDLINYFKNNNISYHILDKLNVYWFDKYETNKI
jgi:hypothetical protein|uniref:Nucleotide-diphospho-sugar transferase domain-containing protein n=1 Tax=viral metagenome TaxID=1070528 RepID=A0A6C0CY03_9ZZZZ